MLHIMLGSLKWNTNFINNTDQSREGLLLWLRGCRPSFWWSKERNSHARYQQELPLNGRSVFKHNHCLPDRRILLSNDVWLLVCDSDRVRRGKDQLYVGNQISASERKSWTPLTVLDKTCGTRPRTCRFSFLFSTIGCFKTIWGLYADVGVPAKRKVILLTQHGLSYTSTSTVLIQNTFPLASYYGSPLVFKLAHPTGEGKVSS